MSDFRHSIEVTGSYSPATARMLYTSLTPEAATLADDRSKTTLSLDGSELVISIEARDLVGLRAAMNTWMNLIRVAESTSRTISDRD